MEEQRYIKILSTIKQIFKLSLSLRSTRVQIYKELAQMYLNSALLLWQHKMYVWAILYFLKSNICVGNI